MQVISRRHAPQAHRPASNVICPCCQGKLVRERRRIVDRLRSLVRPVRRYRCENFVCQWLGNLANADLDRSGSGLPGGVQREDGDAPRSPGVPTAFIVHMILVAVGVVFVIVYGTMEPAAPLDESGNVFGAIVQE